jgi:hypothetical protein
MIDPPLNRFDPLGAGNRYAGLTGRLTMVPHLPHFALSSPGSMVTRLLHFGQRILCISIPVFSWP